MVFTKIFDLLLLSQTPFSVAFNNNTILLSVNSTIPLSLPPPLPASPLLFLPIQNHHNHKKFIRLLHPLAIPYSEFLTTPSISTDTSPLSSPSLSLFPLSLSPSSSPSSSPTPYPSPSPTSLPSSTTTSSSSTTSAVVTNLASPIIINNPIQCSDVQSQQQTSPPTTSSSSSSSSAFTSQSQSQSQPDTNSSQSQSQSQELFKQRQLTAQLLLEHYQQQQYQIDQAKKRKLKRQNEKKEKKEKYDAILNAIDINYNKLNDDTLTKKQIRHLQQDTLNLQYSIAPLSYDPNSNSDSDSDYDNNINNDIPTY
jgi:hypothetical protein